MISCLRLRLPALVGLLFLVGFSAPHPGNAQQAPRTIIDDIFAAWNVLGPQCQFDLDHQNYRIRGGCQRASDVLLADSYSDVLEATELPNAGFVRDVIATAVATYTGRSLPKPKEMDFPGYGAEAFEALADYPESGLVWGAENVPAVEGLAKSFAYGYLPCDLALTQVTVRTFGDAAAARRIARDYITRMAQAYQAANLCRKSGAGGDVPGGSERK